MDIIRLRNCQTIWRDRGTHNRPRLHVQRCGQLPARAAALAKTTNPEVGSPTLLCIVRLPMQYMNPSSG
eukprot:3314434-Alexandrium_andersonii.AAC.1